MAWEATEPSLQGVDKEQSEVLASQRREITGSQSGASQNQLDIAEELTTKWGGPRATQSTWGWKEETAGGEEELGGSHSGKSPWSSPLLEYRKESLFHCSSTVGLDEQKRSMVLGREKEKR